MPPVMAPPPPQEDPRSRRSRTKMKCLISIGLILPALAAVIGVAAWAVSADVVMNSGNSRSSKVDNSLLQQNFPGDHDNRRDILSSSNENQRPRSVPQPPSEAPPPTTRSTTTTTTTTTPAAPVPATLSPQEETDVNAILSKLISASGAANGGTGPRFVVVAPLPDVPDPLQSPSARADKPQSGSKPHSREDPWQATGNNHNHRPEPEVVPAASSQTFHIVAAPSQRSGNLTSRMGQQSEPAAARRVGPPKQQGGPHQGGFHSAQIELTGFDPFDSMMQDFQNGASAPKPQPNNFPGPYQKRGPPQGHFNRNQHKPLTIQFDHPKDAHVFHHHLQQQPDHPHAHGSHPQGVMVPPPGIGLKPIQQQQMHHVDPLRPEESSNSRWGSIGFHGPPPSHSYVHKPPEGISLSISSPSHSGTHVAAEPVSVIKSFFLPFLPKPRLNMNARVVFGVVLDKGMGLGGDKKSAGHNPYH